MVEKTTLCCYLSYFVVPTFERCFRMDSHSVVVVVCCLYVFLDLSNCSQCISWLLINISFVALLTVAVVIRNCRLIENKLFLDALSWQMPVTVNIPLWCKLIILQRWWSPKCTAMVSTLSEKVQKLSLVQYLFKITNRYHLCKNIYSLLTLNIYL